MTPSERRKLEEIYSFMESLKASTSIPLEVDQAFRFRLGLDTVPLTAVSSKNADSEDIPVDEGGAALYDVMGDPVGFLQLTLGNTTYYVPYFNA